MSVALEPDSAVPHRDLLLDPARVRERLARLFGLEIHSCRQVRVKYRIGARLRVVYGIGAGNTRFDVSASTFPSLERSARNYREARERAVAPGPAPPVVHDRELATVFWTFPNDRKIGSLAALAGPARELAELLPGWSRSELVGYAPEKAAAVRCLDDGGRTVGYAKAYAGEEGARALRVHDVLVRALGDDDPFVRLPRALAYSAPHRTLALESVDGSPVRTAEGYRRLGRALARLHELAPPDGARFRRVEPDRLEAAAELIASVRSDVAASARRLAREVAPRLVAGDEDVCLHGDVNFRNAIVQNGRIALIDLDQVAAGPAAAELGSVLASLRYAGIVGLICPASVPELCESLVAGYAEVREPPDPPTLGAYTAAALLGERALRVVTRVRPEGLRRLPALLDDARDVLG